MTTPDIEKLRELLASSVVLRVSDLEAAGLAELLADYERLLRECEPRAFDAALTYDQIDERASANGWKRWKLPAAPAEQPPAVSENQRED